MADRAKRPLKETESGRDVQELRLYAQLGLRIPGDIALRLKRYCQESGKSVNKTVMEALTQYLNQKNR